MILIVGAGPAGLAMAWQLQQRGLPYTVLEKEAVGWAWHNHYDRLRLHTLKAVSALPGLPMPADYPRFVPRQQHLAYLQQYAAHFRLNIKTGVMVQQAAFSDGNWRLETNAGPFAGHTLIAATGIWSSPHRPNFPGQAGFSGSVVHAVDYRNPAPYVGQRVLVVGGGNTGCEIAVDLAEHGAKASIAIRGGAEFVPYPSSAAAMKAAAWFFRHAPSALGEWLLGKIRADFSHLGLRPAPGGHLRTYPVVGFQLPQAVEAGRVQLFACGIKQFTGDGVNFEDGRSARFDAVILATGYRPTLQFIAEQDLARDSRGWPVLEKWRSTRNPRLFCIGYHYPTTEGWLQAIGRVTGEVARQL
ncbi:MAG: NAD(P)/FAD-dependent oxidoreductase [Anaerolineae bacterium]